MRAAKHIDGNEIQMTIPIEICEINPHGECACSTQGNGTRQREITAAVIHPELVTVIIEIRAHIQIRIAIAIHIAKRRLMTGIPRHGNGAASMIAKTSLVVRHRPEIAFAIIEVQLVWQVTGIRSQFYFLRGDELFSEDKILAPFRGHFAIGLACCGPEHFDAGDFLRPKLLVQKLFLETGDIQV